MSSIVFTFGSFNPPTKSHRKLFEKINNISKSKNIDSMILPCSVQDNYTNPLGYYDKINFMKQMFPDILESFERPDTYISNIVKSCVYVYNKGYRNIFYVCDPDRYSHINFILNSYNNRRTNYGFYKFEKMEFIKTGVIEYTSEDSIKYVRDEDYNKFEKTIPKDFDGRVLLQKIRSGLSKQNEF